MVRMITGHLACGRWRLKCEDTVYFLAHPQLFSRRGEYRLGPDQVLAVDIKEQKKNQSLVDITLSDNRFCQALVDSQDLAGLQSMAHSQATPPLAKNQTQYWIQGLVLFFVACTLFEVFK